MRLKQEDTIYAERFRLSQEGHAVWPKLLSSEMKPGACGYFNGDGDWVTIVQLTDIGAVKALINDSPKYTDTDKNKSVASFALVNVEVNKAAGSEDWSEKTSTKIRRQAFDLNSNVL